MPDVIKVRAATNNEVAFLSWDIDGLIPGCLGFEIVRIYPDTGEERCLAAVQRTAQSKMDSTGHRGMAGAEDILARSHRAAPPGQHQPQAGW